jgi:Rieske Fe-S protein
MTETTRRTVLAGAAGLSAAAMLAACGDKAAEDAARSTASEAASRAGEVASKAASALGAAADIPVGGGKVFPDQKVVVTQPTAGSFKAFSAVCTHQACLVNKVDNGVIACPCHGSSYKVSDGSVVTGPATAPLPGASVKIEDGKIVLG